MTDQFELFEALEKLRDAPQDERLHVLRRLNDDQGIQIPSFDAFAAIQRDRNTFTHCVILLHGIQDTAGWYESVGHGLQDIDLVRVVSPGYGFFHVLLFWLPFVRNLPYSNVREQIREVSSTHRVTSIIAHSFGSYLTARIIRKNPDLRFYRVILCGGVVSERFPWHKLPNMPKAVVNDCGNFDRYPLIAKLACFGYGVSGRFGFKNIKVTDRYHDVDHGGFLNEEFAQRYWAPFIRNGEIVPSKRSLSSSWFAGAVSAIPGGFLWGLGALIGFACWLC